MARDPRLKLLEEFLDQLAHQRRLSPGTARNYARALQELFALTDGVPLEKLEPQHMRCAVSELHARGISGRTIAYRLSGWRGFFNWLIKHRGFSHNPCTGLRAPKSPKALPKALSPDLMARLLETPADGAAQLRDKAMFELFYSSGLRLAELGALRSGALGAASRPAAARPPAYAAPLFRHARAAILRRPARSAGNARAFQYFDDAGVHPSGFPASGQGV